MSVVTDYWQPELEKAHARERKLEAALAAERQRAETMREALKRIRDYQPNAVDNALAIADYSRHAHDIARAALSSP